MLKQKEHFHGSDLEKIEAIYGIRKEDIVSYSANVNPLGLSELVKQGICEHISDLERYPDREYTELRRLISEYCGADMQNILIGGGSTELIGLFVDVIAPKSALLLSPTYSEYERDIKMDHGNVTYFQLRPEEEFRLNLKLLTDAITKDTDLLVLCNPNNPTSSIISRGELRAILEHCETTGTFVMVDETYMEFSPEYNEIEAITLTKHFKNLVVLRGVSKFFAAPGLRLGYAVCSNEEIRTRALSLQNPWSVNSLVDAAGRYMFRDTAYISATRELMHSEQERIYKLLLAIPTIHPYKPHGNFILCHILNDVTAQDLFDAAIRKGMMIRNCDTFTSLDESYFRFCFMKPSDNDRLLDCILPLLK